MRRTDEEDEEEEDEDLDELDDTQSRFPAGFRPVRMCRWFPSGNCVQGWVCMFAHSVSELHPQARGRGPCRLQQGGRLLENVDVSSALLGPSVDARPCVSSRDIWKILRWYFYGSLYLAVACSTVRA